MRMQRVKTAENSCLAICCDKAERDAKDLSLSMVLHLFLCKHTCDTL